jgi:transcription elongation factor GreA
MNEIQAVLLTPEGWRRLHDELAALQEQRAALGTLAHDDPSSRADTDPLVEVALLDQRIGELQRVLQCAARVDRAALVPGTVGVGSRVTVRWAEGEEETYTVVGPPEVSPRAGRISYESPVGRALIGRCTGERISVPTAAGPSRLEVVVVDEPASAR